MPGIPGAKGHRGFAGSDGGKGIFFLEEEKLFLQLLLTFLLSIKR